jgi:GT2 family glycosyltransferase
MKIPKVAIGIVNYNTPEMTLEFISNLKNINYKNKDIFLADNYSNKNNLSQLRKGKGFELIEINHNKGYSVAANKIIERVIKLKKYKYILLTNNDLILNDNYFLDKLVFEMEKDEKIGFVGPKIINQEGYIQEGGAKIKSFLISGKRNFVNYPQENFPKEPFNTEFYTACCILVRLDLLKKMKKWFLEEFFCYYEDVEICIRIIKLGYKISVVPSSEIIHLQSSTAKKEGKDFGRYYATRNKLWTMRLHLNRFDFLIGLIYFFLYWVPTRIIWILITSNKPIKSIKSYMDAIKEGLFKKL